MTEFMGLRPKLYTCKTLSRSGDKKCIVKKTLYFEDNKQCLFMGENVFLKQMMFLNELHEICTFKVNEVALNRDNSKQVIQSNDVSMLEHGHKDSAAHLNWMS